MRILESSRYPVNTDGILGWFGTTFISPINYYPTPNYLQRPNSKLYLPAVRLGRVWNVDRFTIQNLKVVNQVNDINNVLSFTYTVELNGIPVSDAVSLSYNIAIQAPGSTDVTFQNGPITITPYNSLEIRSSDQLLIQLNWGTSLPYTGVNALQVLAVTQCQMIGENNPDRISRK